MNHRIILNKVGPIDHCEIKIDDFMVFTGAQASGKSTIAKAIFFFRTVKDDILEVIIKNSISPIGQLHRAVTKKLRAKFLQLFGTSRAMNNDFSMEYYYNNDTFIKITLNIEKHKPNIMPKFVLITLSDNISYFLNHNNSLINKERTKKDISSELNQLFSDEFETIFIPAGRSLITLLTTQLNYLFSFMDDEQRRTLDLCTQKYIERILKIRPNLTEGIETYFDDMKKTSITEINRGIIKKCINTVNHILKGRYAYSEGEERLILANSRYVKINYTSSGQQESVWIFNILLYQLILGTKTFIILEEPEAHLYPDSQKEITELLAMFYRENNSILITTHSPYILGALNNLLYAYRIKNSNNEKQIAELIDLKKLLPKCDCYFVNKGNIESCFDNENNQINNEVIDGASEEINNLYDQLIMLAR